MFDINDLFVNLDFFFKILLAIILGGFIGVERERRKKPAGLKTHILIAIGATIFTYVSINLTNTGDTSRIAAQIVSGIGFIGAGTIFTARKIITGLTTAATLWVSAAIGMLIGADFVIASIIATLTIAVFLWFAKLVTSTVRESGEIYALSVHLKGAGTLEHIDTLIKRFNLTVSNKKFHQTPANHLSLQLKYRATPATHYLFLRKLLHSDGVSHLMKL